MSKSGANSTKVYALSQTLYLFPQEPIKTKRKHMREQEIERYKIEYEQRPDLWKMFGMDLVDAGSPNPCSRSGNARKVLGGRWKEAYEEWVQAGEFSRPLEEIYLGFILATEAIFHRRPSAKVPMPLQ